MVSNSQRHRFDQDGSHLRDRYLSCRFRSVVNTEQIIAIDTNGCHTVTGSTTGDTITSVLIHGSGGYSVAIISTKQRDNDDDTEELDAKDWPEEENWRFERGCKIESSMGITFTGRTFTEVTDHAQTILSSTKHIDRMQRKGERGMADRLYA